MVDLSKYTPARVSLGRAGSGLPTRALLEFQLAHAQARDAVHAALDVGHLMRGLEQRQLRPLALKSAASDRAEYLRDPGAGRLLSNESVVRLENARDELSPPGAASCDIALVVVDGLSALAVDRHALPLIESLMPLLSRDFWSFGPVCVVERGRVAIGDTIGAVLGARFSVVLIGERPGLSSPDSLGVYVTWTPRPGRSDAERNCISNVRPEGLSYAEAARRLAWLLHEAQRRELTGVALKDGIALGDPSGPRLL